MTDSRKCINCGEPEDGLGWFNAADGLFCNACGEPPTEAARKMRDAVRAREAKGETVSRSVLRRVAFQAKGRS